MPDIQLRDVIENLRSRLQTELDSELAALASSHEQALEDARREATAEAEQQWAGRLEAVRADWSTRLQDEVTAVRSDAERQMVAETMRVRVDAEQAAAEVSATLRRELEQALAAEREHAAQELRAERERAAEELRAERERAERAVEDTRAALEAEREKTAAAIAQASTAASSSLDTSRLVAALKDIDEATTLTDVLRATVRAASAEASRATMLIVNGAQLDEWVPSGGSSLGAGAMRVDGREAGFLSLVLKRGEPIAPGPDLQPPAFAAMPAGRKSLGVPLVLGGQTVAVLYADEGSAGTAPAGWMDVVQMLARHAAASLAAITALRTLQALGTTGAQTLPATGPSAQQDEGEGARRYARLLVSEIKLYNEAAVKTGRQMRDLSQRLRPEIERARRLYEERVPPAVAARDMFFHQELVQTLAGGDPSLLG